MTRIAEMLWEACQELDDPQEAYRKVVLLSETKRNALISMMLMMDDVYQRAYLLIDIRNGIWPPRPVIVSPHVYACAKDDMPSTSRFLDRLRSP